MSRDHSTTAWTPDWLGESPGPAHAAPDLDDETRELIDLDAGDLELEAPDPGEDPYEEARAEPHPEPHAEPHREAHAEPHREAHPDPHREPHAEPRDEPHGEPRREPVRGQRRPLVSEGWAEERGRPTADRPTDPAVGSLRALSAVAVTGRRAVRPPSPPRPNRAGRSAGPTAGSTTGLVALVLLALVSAFFAWVTAEPLWLAVGHAESGAVTVTRCDGDRCLGTFVGTGFTRDGVPVMGDAPATGETAPARMTSDRGARAYVDVDPDSRALVGVALILLCGLGIVRTTGVRRLPTGPTRRTAALLGLGGPLVLLAAMLAVTY